jgi:DNA-binding transcriptional ArsR family regulator
VDVFAALADPVRRDILMDLHVRGPMRVVDIASERWISRPAISRHLRVLVEAGLALVEDRGRERHYRFRAEGVAPVVELLDVLDVAADAWVRPDLLAALELEVRRTVRDHRNIEIRAERPDHPKEDLA